MRFSDWQLSRIRNALRRYYALKSAIDGKNYNWTDVLEAVDEYTGVAVPYESVRKFVKGVRQPDGSYKPQTPEEPRLEAIFAFVTNPEVDLLSKDELIEREFSMHAALRLLDYLEQDFDGERVRPPQAISGVYYYWRHNPSHTSVSELTLSSPLENGVVKVNRIERVYPKEEAPDKVAAATKGLPSDHKSEARHVGWGIMTPEDNFFVFLKEERVGKNLYFFTIASDLDHSMDIKLRNLTILHHDYPLEAKREFELGNSPADFIENEISANVQTYERLRGF